MTNKIQNDESRGPTGHSGRMSERTHSAGWQLNKDRSADYESVALPGGRNELYGGQGYDFGSPQDEGDTAARMQEVANEHENKAA